MRPLDITTISVSDFRIAIAFSSAATAIDNNISYFNTLLQSLIRAIAATITPKLMINISIVFIFASFAS